MTITSCSDRVTTGISCYADVPWGTHMAHFYERGEDLADILVPYIQAGLSAGERCLWVTSAPLPQAQAKAALARVVPDLERRIAAGELRIIDVGEWYTATGGFAADRVVAGWLEEERSALKAGYRGLRITGNTAWLAGTDEFASFADYEERLHRALIGHRILCLCSYHLPTCPGATVFDVIKNHEFAVARRDGHWELLEGSESTRTRRDLQRSLSERDVLLNEIHHRVKNNLQVVSSLLAVKLTSFSDPAVLAVAKDLQGSVEAMGLVHQMLYQHDVTRGIDLGDYLATLTRTVVDAGAARSRVDLRIQPEQPAERVTVSLDTATTIGLIVVEVVTNTLKYAFPDGRRGCLGLACQLGPGGRAELLITDDGIGLPAEPPRRAGMGLRLIEALARQIDGRASLDGHEGTTFRLDFAPGNDRPGRDN